MSIKVKLLRNCGLGHLKSGKIGDEVKVSKNTAKILIGAGKAIPVVPEKKEKLGVSKYTKKELVDFLEKNELEVEGYDNMKVDELRGIVQEFIDNKSEAGGPLTTKKAGALKG